MAKTKAEKPREVNLAKEQNGEFKDIGGSMSDDWNHTVANQAVGSLWTKTSDKKTIDRQLNGTLAAIMGNKPRDEFEGMMLTQLVAAHNAAMECYRRAMLPEQTFEGRRENLNQANKLSRSWASLLQAFNKHRGKGQQKVTVEHVHVHEGGQAIVGTVEHPGGGARAKVEEQPHAKQIADASESTLWSEDESRNSVPVPSDAER